MYFAINHKIHSQSAFWSAIEQIKNNLSILTINYAILPNAAMDEAITIWKAPSQLIIEQLIEEQTGDFSRNVYLEIDEKNATVFLHLNLGA
ncbi:MAG: hypothetical protein ACPG19_09155 [Saprospiraceae bacterium]